MAKRKLCVNPEIKRFRRLLEPSLSLDAVWHQLNRRTGAAAKSTVEALMFSLRRGPGVLADPKTLDRLSQLNEEELIGVAARVQKFPVKTAPAWTPEQVEILVAVRAKLK